MDKTTHTSREHSMPDCAGLNVPGAFEIFENEDGFKKHKCTECKCESYGFPRRLNTAHMRYDRDALREVLTDRFYGPDVDLALDDYEQMRREGADKPCQSLVHHGPGSQSTTYCEALGGAAGHDIADAKSYPGAPVGAMIHTASLPSGGWAEWTDDDPYARDY